MKNKLKKPNSGLRNTIEEKIGRKILEKINQTRDETTGPIMIPPIPDSKFIDKLPEGDLEGQNIQEKEHQDSYEAEVRLYRSLEEIEGNFLAIHQLDFTHEQYSAFVGQHLCNKKRCKKGEEEHPCHKEKNLIEGECDMVVLGENFVMIFEVKALNLRHSKEDELKLQGCYESALLQINRMKELIHSIEPSVMVFGFAVFPNISTDEINEILPKGEKLLFREDLKIIGSTICCCKEMASLTTISKSAREKLECCLLGLWCIDPEGQWDLTKSGLSWCIKDIDQKLRKALLTRKSVDAENLKNSTKRGKNKAMKKNYPENPEMVEAPILFQDHLNIRCLTRDQLDVFDSQERFLWIEGPAGAGKTIAMLGKIIDIVLNKPLRSRILIILLGRDITSPAILRHFDLLKGLTTCEIVKHLFYETKLLPGFDLSTTVKGLSEKLQSAKSQIIFLTMLDTYTHDSIYNVIASNFDYVFVDDHHLLTDLLINKQPDLDELNWYEENIVSQGLLPLVEKCDENNTSLWVFYDIVQESYDNISFNQPYYDRYRALSDTLTYFKSLFLNRLRLTVNLRNTVEMSSVLSVIRGHRETVESSGAESSSIDLPEQKLGHVLRGTKAVIQILRENNFDAAMKILENDLKKFKTSECSLDVAVMHYIPQLNNIMEIHRRMKKYGVKVVQQLDCMSAEWPAVICLYRYEFSSKVPDLIGSSGFTSNFYVTVSRARVYFKIIFYNYTPNWCGDTDRLLSELRKRRDICRVIE